MKTFARLESEVRGYCRSFPTVFQSAKGACLTDESGAEYVDFFAGAGVLNYGHNPDVLQQHLLRYLSSDGITHSLDMATTAKRELLQTFERLILRPREMNYKLMFTGPTGTNSVEAAIKLARKVTGRQNIVSFTNGFHGMTLGALALTGNAGKRAGAGVSLNNVTHMPYCDYMGADVDSIELLEQYLEDNSSGLDHPAAFIFETVQAEGGVNVASKKWLTRIAALPKKHKIMLIVDDIQVGCGRTGTFFSFEPYGIEPDIICLSKSLSGYGLPFALTLFKPEHDQWSPGEHNGTFRGHNLAFVTATAALQEYWTDESLTRDVAAKGQIMKNALLDLADEYDGEVSGRGLIQGIRFEDRSLAGRVSQAAFKRGLIIETCGPDDEVIKCLPPLTIAEDQLKKGLKILADSIEVVLGQAASSVSVTKSV